MVTEIWRCWRSMSAYTAGFGLVLEHLEGAVLGGLHLQLPLGHLLLRVDRHVGAVIVSRLNNENDINPIYIQYERY